jgi:uncharacterized protein YueI
MEDKNPDERRKYLPNTYERDTSTIENGDTNHQERLLHGNSTSLSND